MGTSYSDTMTPEEVELGKEFEEKEPEGSFTPEEEKLLEVLNEPKKKPN